MLAFQYHATEPSPIQVSPGPPRISSHRGNLSNKTAIILGSLRKNHVLSCLAHVFRRRFSGWFFVRHCRDKCCMGVFSTRGRILPIHSTKKGCREYRLDTWHVPHQIPITVNDKPRTPSHFRLSRALSFELQTVANVAIQLRGIILLTCVLLSRSCSLRTSRIIASPFGIIHP